MKNMKMMRKMMKDQQGQGMTEYIIIVALIAIAAIGVVTLFGDNVRKLFGASVNALAGSDTANTGAKKPSQTMTGHQNLKTFGNGVTKDGQ